MTTKLEKAARQALEALETDEQWGFVSVKVLERRLPAITALRETLAEQAVEPAGRCKWCLAYNGHLDFCPALAEQAEQEPVAEVHNTDTPSNWSIIKPGLPAGTKLYAAPVRTKDLTDDELAGACGWKLGDPMYEWVVDIGRWAIAADREKNK